MIEKHTSKRMLYLTIVLYLVSFFISLPVAMVFGQALTGYSGNSVFLERLSSGLDFNFLADFIINSTPQLSSLPPLLLFITGVYFILQILFSAGVFRSLANPTEGTLVSFGVGIFKPGWKFLVLFVCFLPIYGVAVGIALGLAALMKLITTNNPRAEMLSIFVGILQIIIIFIALGKVQVLHYMVRAATVAENGNVLPAVRRICRQRLRPFVSLLLKFFGLVLGGGIIVGGLSWVALKSYNLSLLMWLLLQITIFLHIGLRVFIHRVFLSAMSRDLRPAPVVAEPPAVEEISAATFEGTVPPIVGSAGPQVMPEKPEQNESMNLPPSPDNQSTIQ